MRVLRRGQLEAVDNPPALLQQIAVNLARDFVRRRKTETAHFVFGDLPEEVSSSEAPAEEQSRINRDCAACAPPPTCCRHAAARFSSWPRSRTFRSTKSRKNCIFPATWWKSTCASPCIAAGRPSASFLPCGLLFLNAGASYHMSALVRFRASNGRTSARMTEDEGHSPRTDAHDSAIFWWVRKKAGPLSREDQAAFDAWLAAGAAHKAAFDEISTMWEDVTSLRPGPARRRAPAMRLSWFAGAAAFGAASFALLVFHDDMSIFLRSDFYAGTGQTKRVTLADGSHVELNAKSAIAVHYGAGQRR